MGDDQSPYPKKRVGNLSTVLLEGKESGSGADK